MKTISTLTAFFACCSTGGGRAGRLQKKGMYIRFKSITQDKHSGVTGKASRARFGGRG
jgi:hypothetical protein